MSPQTTWPMFHVLEDRLETVSAPFDGHYTVMKFTTHYKVALGTPDIWDDDREWIAHLPSFKSLLSALWALAESPELFVPPTTKMRILE